MSEPISVVYAGNEGIFDGILISLSSLVEHTPHPIHAYVLTMDLSEQNERFTPVTEHQRAFLEEVVQEKHGESRVTLLDVGSLYRKTLYHSPNAKSAYTPYAMLRLLLDRLPVPNKLLYLDADTLVTADVTPLWEEDVTAYEFAAVLDYYGKIFMGYHYINTGVMLLNLDNIRKTNLFARCIDRLCRRRIFLPDQTALNRLVKRKKLLPVCYNEQKHDRDGTVIRHFSKTIIWHPFFPFFYTKNIKPWQTERVRTELTDRYNDTLDRYLRLKERIEKEISV
ncbi:MAG: hypothetical protein IJ009_01220 [Clostridia bacterium]|nr:hypothetical protein [Clostridia bacterium]